MKLIVTLLSFSFLWYIAHCTHFKSRFPPPVTDNPFQQSNGFGENDQGTSQLTSECKIAETHLSSIPTGRTKVSRIMKAENAERPDECVQACCEQGLDNCQYAWILAEKCFLIGCTRSDQELCKPMQLSNSDELKSTYIGVQLDTSTDGGDVTTWPPTAAEIPATTAIPTEADPDNQPLERPSGPSKVIAVTPAPIETETSPTTSTTPKPVVATTKKPSSDHGIIVATNGDTDITLPTTTAKIYGNTWPKPQNPGDYLYKWEKVAGPEQGTIVGKDDKDITLRDLVPGVYTLRLKVTNWLGSDWGEGYINITVHESSHVNSPPVPIILPSTDETINLPQDSVVLDAQTSTDDRGTEGLKFHWEEVAGPLSSDLEADSPLLNLNGLTEGVHEYKLTVTDLDGAVGVATAKVTVLREKDYPPVAHAGNPVVLHLPNNEATLDGSLSKDEGELTYKWTYVSGPGGGDMEGANTAKLHVNHLTLGNHQYQLTVTDSSGQTSTDTVSVIVTAEDNKPPTANAGGNVTVVFPKSEVTLNGEKSDDDYLISGYQWTQLDGPSDVTLKGVDTATLTVSDLHIDESIGSPTLYHFQLTVTDYRNLTDNDTVQITFRKDPHIPPVASAGPDFNITLPQSAVVLDGTSSHDDFGIISYQWVRSKDSPAAGRVMGNSEKTSRLVLSNLVNGTYQFTLKVTNRNGETAEDDITLMVLPNPSDRFLLQVHLDGDITQFTEVDVEHFKHALSYLLFDGREEYNIQVVSVSPSDKHIKVEFFAVGRNSKKVMNTTDAYYKLTEKGQDYTYTSYHIVKVDMKVCQLPCSGHGTCDPKTRKCVCSRFWMENPFKAQLGRKESNCEWSVFYVALVVVGVVAVLLLCCWIVCCCCLRKRRRARSKRRIRYAILDHKGDPETMQMLPKDYKQTSLMVSESETEEEILFESSRKVLNNDTRKGSKNNVKNGKILTGEDKVGNQSSRSSNQNTD